MFLVLKQDRGEEILVGVVENVPQMAQLVMTKVIDEILENTCAQHLREYRENPEKLKERASKEIVQAMGKYKMERV